MRQENRHFAAGIGCDVAMLRPAQRALDSTTARIGLGVLPVLDDELQRRLAAPFVDVRAGRPRGSMRGSGSTWRNRIASKRSLPRASASFEWCPPTIRWSSTEKVSSNTGAGKPWPQTSARSALRELDPELSRRERTVRLERAREIAGRQLLAGDRLEDRRESRQIRLRRASVRRRTRARRISRAAPVRAWPRGRARRADGSRRSIGPIP